MPKVTGVALDPVRRQAVEAAAKQQGVSVSGFLRRLIDRELTVLRDRGELGDVELVFPDVRPQGNPNWVRGTSVEALEPAGAI